MRHSHPLSDYSRGILRSLMEAPMPTHEANPGAVHRLLRENLAVIVRLPSPYRIDKGRSVDHLQITDAGRLRAALAESEGRCQKAGVRDGNRITELEAALVEARLERDNATSEFKQTLLMNAELRARAERAEADFAAAREVIAQFSDPVNWSDRVGCLQWMGKRHAIEYASTFLERIK